MTSTLYSLTLSLYCWFLLDYYQVFSSRPEKNGHLQSGWSLLGETTHLKSEVLSREGTMEPTLRKGNCSTSFQRTKGYRSQDGLPRGPRERRDRVGVNP
jgi:hypothetical protein